MILIKRLKIMDNKNYSFSDLVGEMFGITDKQFVDCACANKKIIISKFKKLPKTCFYVFDNADVSKIPDKAKLKFVQAYIYFRNEYHETAPTMAGIQHAQTIIFDNDCAGDIEKPALKALSKINYYDKLWQEAFDECGKYGFNNLYDEKIRTSQSEKMKCAIFVEHCLRHPEKLVVLKKLNKLRLKIRQQLNLDSNTWIGF